jgi:hypothetical protein
MEHRTINDIAKSARVFPGNPSCERALRRERLERLAALLDQHIGPIRLLSRIEYLVASERALVRADHSPLSIAFQDLVLRAQGLKSDRLGDVTEFFALTNGQAHHLFCDCHYAATVTPAMIAARARVVARRPSLRELWDKLRRVVTRIP